VLHDRHSATCEGLEGRIAACGGRPAECGVRRCSVDSERVCRREQTIDNLNSVQGSHGCKVWIAEAAKCARIIRKCVYHCPWVEERLEIQHIRTTSTASRRHARRKRLNDIVCHNLMRFLRRMSVRASPLKRAKTKQDNTEIYVPV